MGSLSIVGIFNIIRNCYIPSLSNIADHSEGCECQRLALARALYHKSESLILDEVINHMDSSGKEIVKSLIKMMRGRVTLLVISHEEDIRALCEREIVLQ